jgi:lipid-binding SYLF domain-containing protein
MNPFKQAFGLMVTALALWLAATAPAAAKSEQQKCDEAASVARSFLTDPNFASLRAGLRQARAVVVVPRFEPGFWGIDGDDDALLLVQREDGTWSHPAFYDIDDGSVVKGLWGRGGSVLLLVMTDRALEVLMNAFNDVRLGTHLTVAVGPAGNAPMPPNVDIVSFARSYQGYSGGSVAGIDIEIDKGDNQDYYGYGALPRAIMIENRFRNPGADNLRNALIGR